MSQNDSAWPRIVVFGAGAVGSYFGGMLARAGAPVTLIGRPAHVEAISRDGLLMDTTSFRERIRVHATTDLSAVRDAQLVLLCVKTLDIESAAAAIRQHLPPHAVAFSLQNGVDSAERWRTAGVDALSCVVYVAAAVPAPGCVKHSGRGDLVLGDARRTEDVQRAAAVFTRAGIPCRISDNIAGELWAKLVWNCAGNALTALGRASYGRVAANQFARQVLVAAANEVIAVGRAAGITFPDVDFATAGLKLAAALGDATSSTAQDLERNRPTEIDSLNGYVVRRAAELGVPVPVNLTLYALMKLLEERQLQSPGRSPAA